MHCFQNFFQTALLAAPLLTAISAQIGGQCPPADPMQANPIGTKLKYRNYASTGVVNGSTVILPITLTLARSIIPSQYPILTNQIKQWLPSLAADQYPAVLQMELNHDIYHNGASAGPAADYSRASISFPFVDRLNDGYTAMTFNKEIIISSDDTGARAKFQRYGSVVAPGYFSTCNAYEYENGTADLPPKQRGIDQAAWANTNTDLSNPDIAYRLVPTSGTPYSQALFRNITSQPIFSVTTPLCDNMVRLPSTKVSTAPFAAVNVQGDAAILQPFFQPKAKTVWTGVWGLKWAQSYYENGQVTCASLKGFSVVNAPA